MLATGNWGARPQVAEVREWDKLACDRIEGHPLCAVREAGAPPSSERGATLAFRGSYDTTRRDATGGYSLVHGANIRNRIRI
jgi:hypothetical protein